MKRRFRWGAGAESHRTAGSHAATPGNWGPDPIAGAPAGRPSQNPCGAQDWSYFAFRAFQISSQGQR